MTILAGQLLLPSESTNEAVARPGFIRIKDEQIVEVVEGEIPSTADYSNPHALICPGFIDTHLHLPQFNIIGAHSLPLLKWLSDVTFVSEQRWEDSTYAKHMTCDVLRQLLAVGTTSFCAYGSVHHQATLEALKVARDIGFRGAIGQVLMDRNAPKTLCYNPTQLIEEAAITLEQFAPNDCMVAAVTPRFAISCSAKLLSDAGKLAQRSDAIIQTHLAESVNECKHVSQLFDGMSYVDVYRTSGLLNARSLLGHGIHLNDQDRKTLSDENAVIAHCPTANSFLRSGTMNRRKLAANSVRVVLGSDIGAGYERSMVRVGRAMIEAAASIGDFIPSTASAWYDITAGAANVLGWPDVGSLVPDSRADVLLIEPDIGWLDSPVDPLSMLMFAWDDRWIKRTYLRGQMV
ncbi:Guanine deaminase [Planctomycetes bacterium CA13]|uniref:Guanine deaminase n=1 Tax=Novipirellula herctigrandis TaxID=2527986 RepID=A0A5C5YP99_9BACT|nr:Guanine deaminase [Planctomycetes bacterium CA13]